MNTTSKIARLPRDLRNKLNRCLDDAQPGNEILQWLNRDKTVRKILANQFDATPITKQNLSAWKTGDGFLNWKNNRDALDLAKELGGDADETFSEFGNNDEGSPAFADKMALWFSVRYMVMARNLIASVQNADLEKQESAMRRILRDLSALRRSQHSAGRLRLEHKRLEFQKTQGTDAREKAFWKRARSPEVEKEINKPGPLDTREGAREVSVMLFGSGSAFLTEEEREKFRERENRNKARSITPEPTPDSEPDPRPEQSSPVQAQQSNSAAATPQKVDRDLRARCDTTRASARKSQNTEPADSTLVQPETSSSPRHETIPHTADPIPETGGVLGDQHDPTRNTARDRNSVDFTDPYGIKASGPRTRRRGSFF